MPILNVQLVGPVSETVRGGLAQRIADSAAQVLSARPSGTWVTLQFVSSENYAENGGASLENLPVIVRVMQAKPPEGEALCELAARLTRAIAVSCDRPPDNVHLVFEPPAVGRISFGGVLYE